MAESVINNFPSQVVSDHEKASYEYGLKIAKAIEYEWYGNGRFADNQAIFHKRRLYARGEQDVKKYKTELSINGDLSYLNLDWTPVPIISKFVDIVVNGISERNFSVNVYSQDPYGVEKRTAYMDQIQIDMKSVEFNAYIGDAFGLTTQETPDDILPTSQEELDLHMQLTYKQEAEIAEEQAINTLLEGEYINPP